MGRIKELPILGMNSASDVAMLPDHYIPVEQPYYRGDGEHSVYELQELCKQYKEYCHQQAIIKSELIKEIKSL